MASPNKYRNPERDRYYEELEKSLMPKERREVVVKNGQVIDSDADDTNEKNEKKDDQVAPQVDSEEEGNWKKRYGDLRRHLASKEREWQEKESALNAEIERLRSSTATAGTKAPELPSNLSDEKIEEWKQKFPDVANIIDYIAQKRAREIASGLEEKVSDLEEHKKTLNRQRAYLMLLKEHEDFEAIRTSEEFRDWLGLQEEEFQNAIVRPNFDGANLEAAVRKAARVVQIFKLETGWGQENKAKEKPKAKDVSAAQTVPSHGTGPDDHDSSPRFTESQIAKMSPREFERLKDQILEAQRKGPPYFIHDMTGAAQ